MSVRSTYKMTILVLSLAESLVRFALLRARTRVCHRRDPSPAERAAWLHGCCRRILSRLRVTVTTNAKLPANGLLVSNHLSHLDILFFAALGPVIFVAKEEVRGWPLLGTLAKCGGTVFVDRQRPAQAASAAKQMEVYLHGDVPVVLFPEGTSSDGACVLPFRSSLFEPAMRAGCAITAAAISYSADGVEESELTYWGDNVFFPNLYATLGCRNLEGRILLAGRANFRDRKEAARMTHAEVVRLRAREERASLSDAPKAADPRRAIPA